MSYVAPKLVAWFQSPDGTSLIEVRRITRHNRIVHAIVRANLAGETITTIAHRTTEAQARKRANLVWLTDKYGEAEALRRYTEMYPASN